MGKDYTPIKLNNLDIKKAYSLLLTKRIKEASTLELFNLSSIASIRLSDINEIEIGTDNTKECIIRLSNNDFVVLSETIDLSLLNGGV